MSHRAQLLTQLLGTIAMFGAIIAVVIYVNDRGATQRHEAERIVHRSQVTGCERSAQNAIADMNAWYEVDLADFRVAKSPETKPEAAHIRLIEASGIDREEIRRAARIDYHYASELHSPAWRAVALKARFSCTVEFPLP